jgi:hypothetical protein
MVIDNFHVIRAIVTPLKTNTPLRIDANAVLSFSVAPQGLQPVAAQSRKIRKTGRGVEPFQSAFGLRDEPREAADPSTLVEGLRIAATEGPYHGERLSDDTCYVKHNSGEA